VTATGVRWSLLALIAVVGGALFGWFGPLGTGSGISFVGGVAMVVGALEFGTFNIRFAGRYVPRLTLAVALLSYVTTTVALGLVLAASSPRVVDGRAVAVGLFAGLSTWIGTEIARARVRSEAP
jgi:hypothetical protein